MAQSNRNQVYIATALREAALLGHAPGPAVADVHGNILARAQAILAQVRPGVQLPVGLTTLPGGPSWQVLGGQWAGLHVPYHSPAWSVNPGGLSYFPRNFFGPNPSSQGGPQGTPTFFALPGGALLQGQNWSAAAGAFQYAGAGPATFTPAPINSFQTAIDIRAADPNNPQDVAYIANNYFRGDQGAARRAIVNAAQQQSLSNQYAAGNVTGDVRDPVTGYVSQASIQAAVNSGRASVSGTNQVYTPQQQAALNGEFYSAETGLYQRADGSWSSTP